MKLCKPMATAGTSSLSMFDIVAERGILIEVMKRNCITSLPVYELKDGLDIDFNYDQIKETEEVFTIDLSTSVYVGRYDNHGNVPDFGQCKLVGTAQSEEQALQVATDHLEQIHGEVSVYANFNHKENCWVITY